MTNKKKILFFLLSQVLMLFSVIGEEQAHLYHIEANVITGNGSYAPFWLINNNHGIKSLDNNNGYLRVGISKALDNKRKFSYGYGLDLVGAYNNNASFFIQQAYIDLKYTCLELTIGSKEISSLIQDPSLSSGSMVWSGNSRPIPQVFIGIPNFVNFPWTNGIMQIKGGISYGMYTDNNYQKDFHKYDLKYAENILFHRKYLLLKFEKEAPFYGIIGIDMAAQFGGKIYFPQSGNVVISPSNFKAFIDVFIPRAGGSDSNIQDQVNILGNQLGSYLMEFGYRRNKSTIRAYYEHYFDDHSGMIFKNKFDGVWGLEYRIDKRTYISGLLFEFITTRNQSGPFLWDKTPTIPTQVSNGDNYYNNIYPGWTHWGMSQGTPLIMSPAYNDGYLGFTNNRVRAFHVGIDGHFATEFKYRILASHQRGWGTPNTPFINISNQFSALAEVEYQPRQLKGWAFKLSGALDSGTLFDNNWGLQFNIKKNGTLFSTRK